MLAVGIPEEEEQQHKLMTSIINPYKRIYEFKIASQVWPVDLDVTLPDGFYIGMGGAGEAMSPNENGYYTINENETAEIYINDKVAIGSHDIHAALVLKTSTDIFGGGQKAKRIKSQPIEYIWRSDKDPSKGHNMPMGHDNLAIAESSYDIGPFNIVEDDFDIMDNSVNDLHASFIGIELCKGGCNAENGFLTYDEDDFNRVQNELTLTRSTPMGAGKGAGSITWEYSGYTKSFGAGEPTPIVKDILVTGPDGSITGSGIRDPIVYERDYSESFDPCNCDDIGQAGYVYAKATLLKDACCDDGGSIRGLAGSDTCKDSEGNDLHPSLLHSVFSLNYYTLGGSSTEGNLFAIEWCSADMQNTLNENSFENDNTNCLVTGDPQVLGVNGYAYIEFESCGISVGLPPTNTPTTKPSCTVSASVTSSISPSPSASPSDSPSPSATDEPEPSESPTQTPPPGACTLVGLVRCTYEGWAEDLTCSDIIAFLLNDDLAGGVPLSNMPAIRINGECYKSAPLYPGEEDEVWRGRYKFTDMPPIVINSDGTAVYASDPALRQSWWGQPLNTVHQMIFSCLSDMHCYDTIYDIDPIIEFYNDCEDCYATDTATASVTPSPSASQTASPSASQTASPTDSVTESPTGSATPSSTTSHSGSASPSPSASASPSITPSASPTPSATPTSSATASSLASVSATASVSAFSTPTATESSALLGACCVEDVDGNPVSCLMTTQQDCISVYGGWWDGNETCPTDGSICPGGSSPTSTPSVTAPTSTASVTPSSSPTPSATAPTSTASVTPSSSPTPTGAADTATATATAAEEEECGCGSTGVYEATVCDPGDTYYATGSVIYVCEDSANFVENNFPFFGIAYGVDIFSSSENKCDLDDSVCVWISSDEDHSGEHADDVTYMVGHPNAGGVGNHCGDCST